MVHKRFNLLILFNSFSRSKIGFTPFEKIVNKKRNFLTGLTFLEVIITLTLYTVAFLGVFQLFNVSLNTNKKVNQGVIATHLAEGFMAEIMAKAFVDPENPLVTTLGPNGAGETGRSTYDDVDDYKGYSETPPKTLGGVVMDGTNNTPNYSVFRRSVDVYYCQDGGSGNIVPTGSGGTVYSDWKCVSVTVTAPDVKTCTIDELIVK